MATFRWAVEEKITIKHVRNGVESVLGFSSPVRRFEFPDFYAEKLYAVCRFEWQMRRGYVSNQGYKFTFLRVVIQISHMAKKYIWKFVIKFHCKAILNICNTIFVMYVKEWINILKQILLFYKQRRVTSRNNSILLKASAYLFRHFNWNFSSKIIASS